jgi:hypothetical protein
MSIHRQLGDRARTVTRERDHSRGGMETTRETLKGLQQNEANGFDQEWMQSAAHQNFHGNAPNRGRSTSSRPINARESRVPPQRLITTDPTTEIGYNSYEPSSKHRRIDPTPPQAIPEDYTPSAAPRVSNYRSARESNLYTPSRTDFSNTPGSTFTSTDNNYPSRVHNYATAPSDYSSRPNNLTPPADGRYAPTYSYNSTYNPPRTQSNVYPGGAFYR